MDQRMIVLGQRMKLLRKEHKLTQTQLGEILGYTNRQYQRMEYGEVNVPSLTLIAVADYFHVSTDYLLGRTEERQG